MDSVNAVKCANPDCNKGWMRVKVPHPGGLGVRHTVCPVCNGDGGILLTTPRPDGFCEAVSVAALVTTIFETATVRDGPLGSIEIIVGNNDDEDDGA